MNEKNHIAAIWLAAHTIQQNYDAGLLTADNLAILVAKIKSRADLLEQIANDKTE